MRTGHAEDELQHALDRLMSLRDGDHGVLEIIACGRVAIPELKTLLFKREPSGIFEPRCHVVDALAALGDRDVLREFLDQYRPRADPVEDAGERAVVNAAARALHADGDEALFRRLLFLAEAYRLPGPIDALGRFKRAEALPCLIASLCDDLARPAAQAALLGFEQAAVPALVDTLRDADRDGGWEFESSLRRRRAALALLSRLRPSAPLPAVLCLDLMRDADPAIAAGACHAALVSAAIERQTVIRRLRELLPQANWLLRMEIEEHLASAARDP